MAIYFAHTFRIELSDQRLIELTCEQCHSNYCYWLTRTKTGVADAPYFIGLKYFERQARKDAERALTDAMENDRELVPCPKCKWINSSSIHAFRKTHCQNYGVIAWLILIVGFASTAIIAIYILMFDGLETSPRFVAIVGVIATLILSVPGFIVRRYLRSRINPNANHPRDPELPPGTPCALIRDPSTGELTAPRNPSSIFPSPIRHSI